MPEVGSLYLSVYRRRAIELSVIEGVECLYAELKRSCIGHPYVFRERQIKVANPGAIEDATLCVAELSQGFLTKERGVEGWTTVAPVGIYFERSRFILRGVEKVVVCTVAQCAYQ